MKPRRRFFRAIEGFLPVVRQTHFRARLGQSRVDVRSQRRGEVRRAFSLELPEVPGNLVAGKH